jgi:hypothetical protein
MTIPNDLLFSVVAGSVATIAAMILGVSQALKRSKWAAARRRRTVLNTAVVLIGWFAVAIALSSLGVYRATAAQLPTIEFGIVIPILLGGLLIWRWPTLSGLIDVLPRQWVIAVQFYRVEGLVFLILYATNRLPGLFALPAGLGDLTVGLLALAIGIGASGGRQLRSRSVLRWNVLGIADLVVALATGFLTTPSPLQKFSFDHPNELISVFPLVLIPTFLVPLAILLHIVSLVQLGRATSQADGSGERAFREVRV